MRMVPNFQQRLYLQQSLKLHFHQQINNKNEFNALMETHAPAQAKSSMLRHAQLTYTKDKSDGRRPLKTGHPERLRRKHVPLISHELGALCSIYL